MTWLSDTAKLIERHEGRRATPYQDSKGIWSVGVGRNLTTSRFTDDEIDLMLASDVSTALEDAKALFVGAWPGLSETRRTALVDMAFNLGRGRLATFVKLRAAVARMDWAAAADEMLDSRWHTDVGHRADALAAMMRTGEWL